MTTNISWTTDSPESTQLVAEKLGSLMVGGEVLAMQGDLGAGKTCFVQGLAQGIDVPPDVYVRSPTFTLIDEYPGRLPMFHLDLYRLADLDELEAIGWRECLNGKAVVAVEWADRLEDFLPQNVLVLTFHLGSGNIRTMNLKALGQPPEWWGEWVNWLNQQAELSPESTG